MLNAIRTRIKYAILPSRHVLLWTYAKFGRFSRVVVGRCRHRGVYDILNLMNLVLGAGKSKIETKRKQIDLGSEISSVQSTEWLRYRRLANNSVINYYDEAQTERNYIY